MNDILFKFARDWKQIYCGDSNAAKAAGHELLCIRSVLQLDAPDIFTPLTTLVDCAGFRVTAVSLLPIDSTTLGKIRQHKHNLASLVVFLQSTAQTMEENSCVKEHKSCSYCGRLCTQAQPQFTCRFFFSLWVRQWRKNSCVKEHKSCTYHGRFCTQAKPESAPSKTVLGCSYPET